MSVTINATRAHAMSVINLLIKSAVRQAMQQEK